MIVDSVILSDSIQKGGRRKVTERHTDSEGLEYFAYYIAEVDTNVKKIMADRVPFLDQQILDAETEEKINSDRKSVSLKVNSYFSKLSDADIKSDVLLTDDELVVFKKGLDGSNLP